MRENVILLVEDDPFDARLFQRAFSKSGAGASLRIVGDGEAAVAYLKGAGPYSDRAAYPRPSVMILDLKLPRKSGLEVLEWLRGEASLRRLPVVILTSSRQVIDVNRAYDLGANSYLVKPLKNEDLQHLVTTLEAYWLTLNEPPEVPHV